MIFAFLSKIYAKTVNELIFIPVFRFASYRATNRTPLWGFSIIFELKLSDFRLWTFLPQGT